MAVEAPRELRKLEAEGPQPRAGACARRPGRGTRDRRPGCEPPALRRSRSPLGRDAPDDAAVRAKIAATTPPDVTRVLTGALNSLLMLLPFEEPLTAEECDGSALPVAPDASQNR